MEVYKIGDKLKVGQNNCSDWSMEVKLLALLESHDRQGHREVFTSNKEAECIDCYLLPADI